MLCFLISVLQIIPAVLVNSAVIPQSDASSDASPVDELKQKTENFHEIGQGSDHGLYNEGFFEGDIYRKRPRLKNAVADKSMLWPYGAIIYRMDERIGCPDSPQCDILMKAFDHYHRKSCIRFKEWTGEESYVRIFFNPDSGACWSAVGRVRGEQMLSLGQRCWYSGIVIHELGHAIGFWHEMNRPDRDSYISIIWGNIIPGFSSAFAKHDSRSVDMLGENFDYKSIMMYDEYAFSKDGISPTIKAKDNSIIGPIWKKPGLSSSDIRRLHKLYSCEDNSQMLGFPYDVGCNFNENTCGFKNGGSSSWSWRKINKTEGYAYTSSNSSGNSTGYFMSVNFHAVVPESRKNAMGCVKFWYLVQGDGEAYFRLRQSYLNRVTQLVFVPEDTFDLWENENVIDKWTLVELPIYVSRPFKLIFESAFNSSTNGVIALDDLQISYTQCESQSTEIPPSETTPVGLRDSDSPIPVYGISESSLLAVTTDPFSNAQLSAEYSTTEADNNLDIRSTDSTTTSEH